MSKKSSINVPPEPVGEAAITAKAERSEAAVNYRLEYCDGNGMPIHPFDKGKHKAFMRSVKNSKT